MDARALHEQDTSAFDLDVVCSGTGIDDAVVAYARRKVHAAGRSAPGPVLFGRIKLKHEPHRSIERRFAAAASLDVDGHVVRAEAAGHNAREAVDLLEERLRRQLLDAHQRIRFLRRRDTGVAAPGEWRHGDEPTARPEGSVGPTNEGGDR
jgi:ribosome-associated translation inhibitor RaiA